MFGIGADADTSSAEALVSHASEQLPTPPCRVLLVEDSDTHAALVDGLLRARGDDPADGFGCFVLTRAATLTGACELLVRGSSFDCLLVDLTLPDAQGLMSVETLVQLTNAPIVVMTGDSDTRRATEAMAIGAQDYLIKSAVDSHDLVRAMYFAVQRAALQRDLREAHEARDAAVRRLDEFLHLAAHELMSPLATVVTTGRLLRGRWEHFDDATRQQFLSTMTNVADVTVTFARQLLDLASNRHAATPVPDVVDVSIREAVADALAMSGVAAVNIGGVEDLFVRADPTHVRIVLRNLISNADRYGQAPITVTGSITAGRLDLTVTDGGPGVTEGATGQLFRYRSGSDVEGSNGLGLYLAKMLATANDATLTYARADDATHFTLSLPA